MCELLALLFTSCPWARHFVFHFTLGLSVCVCVCVAVLFVYFQSLYLLLLCWLRQALILNRSHNSRHLFLISKKMLLLLDYRVTYIYFLIETIKNLPENFPLQLPVYYEDFLLIMKHC